MCIVIDMNTLPAVFDEENQQHQTFVPVKNWILKGKGKMVYGGNTYKGELKKLSKFIPVLAELKKSRKIIEFDDAAIDLKEKAILQDLKTRGINSKNKSYNDAHLVAIISFSRVKVICSLDKSSYRFLREIKYYQASTDRPVIYSNLKNISLIQQPRYFAQCCK